MCRRYEVYIGFWIIKNPADVRTGHCIYDVWRVIRCVAPCRKVIPL